MRTDPVRAAQTQLDEASAELKSARATLDGAAAVYHEARLRPGGLDHEKARTAWSLALQDWARVLIRREGLVDLVAVERRRADRGAADELSPTGGAR